MRRLAARLQDDRVVSLLWEPLEERLPVPGDRYYWLYGCLLVPHERFGDNMMWASRRHP